MRVDSFLNRATKRVYINADIKLYDMDNKYLGTARKGETELLTGTLCATAIFCIEPMYFTDDYVNVYICQWDTGKFEDTIIYKNFIDEITIRTSSFKEV